jgi:kumamolisin
MHWAAYLHNRHRLIVFVRFVVRSCHTRRIEYRMQRHSILKWIFVASAVLLCGISIFSVALMAHATSQSRVPVNGQVSPLISHSRMVGSASSQQQLQLSIGLKMRNEPQLATLLHDLYTPGSSQFHHFLTPQQFAAEFAPTQAQQQQVIDYLRSEGMTVTQVAPNGLLIDATTNIATAQNAFQVQINTYQSGSRSFYANAAVPTIPDTLSSLILSIGGMDNSVHQRPLAHLIPSTKSLPSNKAQSGNGYGPADLRGAYDSTPLTQANIQGSNQTVAVFELDGYNSSDINQYFKNNTLGTPNVSNVLVDGYDGSANVGAIEVELDIEVVGAMAPKAPQIVYEGPNTTQGVNDTYNQIVTDGKAQIMTTSWGECEAQSGTAELQTLDGIFKQAAAQGMTLFAAAGDSGAYDCNDENLAVDSPADDPYITGVGGTNLQLSGTSYGSESVWSNAADTQRSPKGSGGGGGLSTVFAQSSWQTGAGVNNQYSNGKREVPDISADADPQTGYAIYCTVSAAGCSTNGDVEVGGTSAAAPLWAGSLALVNEYLQQQGKAGAGFINPLLYNLANTQLPYAPFHDVTQGNNLFYPATAGYDLASGLGSPDIYNLARDLAASSSSGPAPTPTPASSPTSTPTPLSSPTPVPPTPTPSSGPFIQNGGFENGFDPWQEYSAAGYELVSTQHPHAGQYGAYLCGYRACNDVLSQDFIVPTKAAKVTLSYWWSGRTNRTAQSCQDSFSVLLLDSKNKVIATLQRVCNNNLPPAWQQRTSDVTSALSPYAGQTVSLIFTARTKATQVTTAFFLDDINSTIQ